MGVGAQSLNNTFRVEKLFGSNGIITNDNEQTTTKRRTAANAQAIFCFRGFPRVRLMVGSLNSWPSRGMSRVEEHQARYGWSPRRVSIVPLEWAEQAVMPLPVW